MNKQDWALAIMFTTVIVGLFVGGFLYERMIWNECRSHGFSFFYCMRMLDR
jgi:hypothetical protein